ncbi:MAG: MBL fold metallo-hydrolase [Dactylosporangium sp.]|nr:MBL fold metallo-hydrolase [Dactylosporangium sp.]NNJ62315.1 MBL fold metallo-hydrolase [Dactylosporangium sp.]
MVEIIPLDTPSLGDRSYIVHDGEVAIVVDPQRDYDRVLAVTGPRGLRITHVFETHIHNDYVTGGYRLARTVGAAYVLNADDTVGFDRVPARDGDIFETGRLRVRALHTPGHTFTHLSYALEADGQHLAIFTGGSLLYGSTGRPDLLGTQHADTLARHQHSSARRIATELPPEAEVYPTHGFGSFCSATQADGLSSTVGAEAKTNPVLTLDQEAYVRVLLAGLDAYPAYYAHMAPANAAGPAEVDLTPPEQADPEELRRRIHAGEWVIDLRERTAFAAGHLGGTLNIGLDGNFVTYLGWLIPWGMAVTLLGESAEQVAEAQRDLARIGIDRPEAAAVGTPEAWSGGMPLAILPTANFTALREAMRTDPAPTVLDVRRAAERQASHLLGSLHVPLHELSSRLAEVPTDRQVWVHCAAGYRAAIAASMLAREGVSVVLVDDDYDRVSDTGLPVLVAA